MVLYMRKYNQLFVQSRNNYWFIQETFTDKLLIDQQILVYNTIGQSYYIGCWRYHKYLKYLKVTVVLNYSVKDLPLVPNTIIVESDFSILDWLTNRGDQFIAWGYYAMETVWIVE